MLLYGFSLLLCINHTFMYDSHYIQAWIKVSGDFHGAYMVQNDHAYIVIIIQWYTPFESSVSLHILPCSHLKYLFFILMVVFSPLMEYKFIVIFFTFLIEIVIAF